MKRVLCLILLFNLSTLCCSSVLHIEKLTQRELSEIVAELEKEIEKNNTIEDAYSAFGFFLNIVGCVLGFCCCCFIAHECCLTSDVEPNNLSDDDPMIQ